jgi:cytidine deaminase
MNFEKKYELVLEAYNNAYAKYSNFQVGAVVITKDGKYFLGSNIENASFGLTNCAERSALFSAYSNGVKKDDIEELVLIGRSNDFLYPCGACRQVISELMNKDAKITLFRLDKNFKEIKVNDLMPFIFDESELNAK